MSLYVFNFIYKIFFHDIYYNFYYVKFYLLWHEEMMMNLNVFMGIVEKFLIKMLKM